MRCPYCGGDLCGSYYTTNEDGELIEYRCPYCGAWEEQTKLIFDGSKEAEKWQKRLDLEKLKVQLKY